MDTIAIKNIFEDKRFSELIYKYYADTIFDMDELQYYSPIAWEMDMMETRISRLPVREKSLNISLGVYEIKTIEFRIKN